MLKHIVMFRIIGDGEKKEKKIHLFKDKLDELKNKIKEVKYLETGINISKSPSAYDVILTTHFESELDLDVYRNHPEHQKVAGLIKELVREVGVVDYII